MTHILDTTLPLASRRDIFREFGRDSFRVHRACAELYRLPASVVAEVRTGYRARRRDGQRITDARSKALLYLDGYVAGWRARGAELDYPPRPGSDAWYARQDVTA